MAITNMKPEQEPSIEEILESIRQIISEEDVVGAKPATLSPPATPLTLASSLDLSAPPEERPAASSLDLSVAQTSESASTLDMSVLDLTEKVNMPETIEMIEIVDEPIIDKPMIGKPMTTDNPAIDNLNNLMSSQTAEAATEALSKLLTGNIAIEKDDVSHAGKVTLEEITRELMMPLIKTWIDQNLPSIIEKVVQREIEKLSRRAMDR